MHANAPTENVDFARLTFKYARICNPEEFTHKLKFAAIGLG